MLDNKIAIASPSLGQHASHTLKDKILAASQAGFSGIEITYPDLEAHAKTTSASMVDAAQQIKNLCKDHDIYILAFAPFENFEGNKSPLEQRLEKAKHWLQVARALGAEHLQVPSIYLKDINDDRKTMVSELRQLADLAASSEPVVKIGYENLGWGTHCSLWQEALEIVDQVDRKNFGLCLDTFHLAVLLWADPYTESSKNAFGEERLEYSLRAFIKDCPVEKIFYVQLSDGERMSPPYSKNHPWYDASLEPAHVWSNEARPFPLETSHGAFMPVDRITRAFLIEKGFSGWVSLETFDRRMRKEENGPVPSAKRGIESWRNLRAKLLSDRSSGGGGRSRL